MTGNLTIGLAPERQKINTLSHQSAEIDPTKNEKDDLLIFCYLNATNFTTMKKLFLSLIITLGAVYSPNIWAEGSLRTGGKSLTDQGRTTELNTWLLNICGANNTTSSCTITNTPQNEVGDVYFVGINHYWKGVNDDWDAYTQINSGVDKIEKVSDDSKQTTSSGTFYTYEATNANKFFFIVRRETMKTNHPNYSLGFKWYDEWSYVENTSGGYVELVPSYDQLRDGAPFFSPHNCDTSLDTNHYITLNDKEDDTEESIKGYNFTSFLYVPTGASDQSSFNKVGTGEIDYYKDRIVYVYTRNNAPSGMFGGGASRVSRASSSWYVKNADGTYSKFNSKSSSDYYYYTTTANTSYEYTPVEIYVYGEIQTYENAPYVFFYTDALGGKRSEKKSLETGANDCPYDAILNWTTSFDKYKRDVPNTKYDGMKEHYILERSYDKISWEPVEGVADVEGDDVTDATKKTFTDTNLKDFDETTKKIGYTVYYRLTSVVQKSDGTEMARRVAPEIVTILIPGSSPFSITLEDGSESEYVPGKMVKGEYTDGYNVFTNALIAEETPEHDEVILATDAKLELVRTDAEHRDGIVIAAYTVTDASMDLASLAKKIGDNGRVEETFQTAAGDAKDAQYQLRLTINNDQVLSNLVDIVGSKVSHTAVEVHRSGTPDEATCAATEMMRNEVTFRPADTGLNTGYYIYRNGEKVMTLVDNGNLTFTDEATKALYKEDANGMLTVWLNEETDPIAVGEDGESDGAEFYYAVVHYDKNTGNTYGSRADAATYAGGQDELVLNLAQPEKGNNRIGYSYNTAFIRPTISWSKMKDADDVKSPIRYEIFRKVDYAEFEKNGQTATAVAEYASGTDIGQNLNNYPYMGEYVKVAEVDADKDLSYYEELYYTRKQQSSGNWVNPLSDDEIRPISYYIKAIYSDDEAVAQNVKEKNSNPMTLNAAEGSIFTAVDNIQAEGVSVTAADGVITVTGITGTITVYGANGAVAASAEGNGGATTIPMTSGVYVVKAVGLNPTKILIK